MARSGYMGVAVIAVIMAISFQEASALKCWRCSSDASNGVFCNDPFDINIVGENQRRWSLVECLSPGNTGQSYNNNPFNGNAGYQPGFNTIPANQRAVCRKTKQLVNDKYIISRSCYWEHIDAHKNDCLASNTPSYIKTEFCETCSTDGCNGAAQYGPAALLVAIPVAVAKILLL